MVTSRCLVGVSDWSSVVMVRWMLQVLTREFVRLLGSWFLQNYRWLELEVGRAHCRLS